MADEPQADDLPDLRQVPYSGCGATTAARAPSLAMINWPASR